MVTTGSLRGGGRAAAAVRIVTDAAAAVIGLWILMFVLEANQGHGLVAFVRGVADWLAGWSRDMFLLEPDWARVLVNYGTAAVVYLFAGRVLAASLRRL